MFRFLRRAAVSCSALLLAGCATGVRTDFGHPQDLVGLRTFHVLEEPLSVPDDATLTAAFPNEELREEIRLELSEAGFQPASAETADFLVGFHVVYDQRIATQTTPAREEVQLVGRAHRGRYGFDRYGGFDRFGYGGFGRFGYGDLGPRLIGEGTLVIDVIDRRTQVLAWRGWSHRRISERRPTPEDIGAALGALVPRILGAFPPDSTARRSGPAPVPTEPRNDAPLDLGAVTREI